MCGTGAWLDHLLDVDPSAPFAPLAPSVTFQDHPDSDFRMELRDQYNGVLAQGANLASGTGQRTCSATRWRP